MYIGRRDDLRPAKDVRTDPIDCQSIHLPYVTKEERPNDLLVASNRDTRTNGRWNFFSPIALRPQSMALIPIRRIGEPSTPSSDGSCNNVGGMTKKMKIGANNGSVNESCHELFKIKKNYLKILMLRIRTS
jgi:hypothetical protein